MKKSVQILKDILLFIPAVLAWMVMLLISLVHGVVDGLKQQNHFRPNYD